MIKSSFCFCRVKTDYQEEVQALKRTQELQKVKAKVIKITCFGLLSDVFSKRDMKLDSLIMKSPLFVQRCERLS